MHGLFIPSLLDTGRHYRHHAPALHAATLEPLTWNWSHWLGRLVNRGGGGGTVRRWYACRPVTSLGTRVCGRPRKMTCAHAGESTCESPIMKSGGVPGAAAGSEPAKGNPFQTFLENATVRGRAWYFWTRRY